MKLKGSNKKTSSSNKVISTLKHFSKIFDKATKDEQKNLLALFIKKIEFDEDSSSAKPIKSIQFNFPVSLDKTNKDIITMDLMLIILKI